MKKIDMTQEEYREFAIWQLGAFVVQRLGYGEYEGVEIEMTPELYERWLLEQSDAARGEGEPEEADVLDGILGKLLVAGVERDRITHLVESLCQGVDENTKSIQAGFKAAEKRRQAAEIRRALGAKNVLDNLGDILGRQDSAFRREGIRGGKQKSAWGQTSDKLDTLSANVQKMSAGLKEMQEFLGQVHNQEITDGFVTGTPIPDAPVASTTLDAEGTPDNA